MALLLLGAGLTEAALYRAIRRAATMDEARPAGAIVVFGAAQYNGRPSPVFKARLDHAFSLAEGGLAPVVITTGAGGGDARFTEAAVGRDYLVQRGLAENKIIADPVSRSSYESVRAATALLRKRGARNCLVVSDGFHLYRIKKFFAAEGIEAFGSPVPGSSIESDPLQRTLHSLRELMSVTLWQLGIRG